MGTGKSGRYLNTRGSGRVPSQYAIVHSNEGTFSYQSRKDGKQVIQNMKSGGHGQANMVLLKKARISYGIIRVFPNGVRVGWVENHKDKRKRRGSNCQAWFPVTWTQHDIYLAGMFVAGLRPNRHVPDGRVVYGIYKGVRVGVMRTHGQIATIFPDMNFQPKPRK